MVSVSEASTNNDLEGWHYRLNAKTRKNSLPLYVLLELLYREAVVVTWQMRMLPEVKVLRRQRARQQQVESKLHELAEICSRGDICL